MSFAFQKPRIRLSTTFSPETSSLLYKGNDFELEFDSNESVNKFNELFKFLEMGLALVELQAEAERIGYSKDELDDILHALDDCRLLTEVQQTSNEGMTGLELAFHLEDLYFNEWKPKDGETPLTQLFLDGQPSTEIITGWSFEYYNVTKLAHDAIISLVLPSHGKVKAQAVDFYNEEYRHDKLMLKSLQALGYTEVEIESSIPLPATLALINLLAHWGKTDPLSYMASLFIYEGEVSDYRPYTDALRNNGMPDEFVHGQEVHNDINVDGGHGFESREFLSLIPFVSNEDIKRVEFNLRRLIETERLVHEQIMSYYQSPQVSIPRRLNVTAQSEITPYTAAFQSVGSIAELAVNAPSQLPKYDSDKQVADHFIFTGMNLLASVLPRVPDANVHKLSKYFVRFNRHASSEELFENIHVADEKLNFISLQVLEASYKNPMIGLFLYKTVIEQLFSFDASNDENDGVGKLERFHEELTEYFTSIPGALSETEMYYFHSQIYVLNQALSQLEK